ncbi:MAG TPA: glycerate kinase [Candidatus Hydrogenedentes bacterium]|nr:glycerate kinase [Candidatus Hydrogenedentota bacterium]HRK33342.1 glycerate kinase [Candidatus Hydrogenedentota bacterium]
MRVIIAPDSFKECLSAARVAAAVAEGVLRAAPDAEVIRMPMADGGEGTVEALVSATRGVLHTTRVTGPIGVAVDAVWGMLGDGRTAVIEMAAASGLALVPKPQRDPRIATTRGTGELMREALDRGVTRMILGLGGSATNDGGAGMAQALGYSLRNASGAELPPGGAALAQLAEIYDDVHPMLERCQVLVACDVTNPLCGPRGASRVYGPQKGATPEMVEELDAALAHYARVIEAQRDLSVADIPGAGAAGGIGAGLIAFANGRLRSGLELIADACGLDDAVRHADLVITGEGCIDAQSVNGKTPVGVARIAKRHRVPVVAVAGMLGEGFRAVYSEGIDAAFSIASGPSTLDESIARAEEQLAFAGEAIAGIWLAHRRLA